MGEKWGKMGKKWVKNEITGVQKTVLMHASARLAKVFAKHGLECPVDEAVEAAMRAYPKQAGALCAQWDAYGAKCAAPTVNHGDMRVRGLATICFFRLPSTDTELTCAYYIRAG